MTRITALALLLLLAGCAGAPRPVAPVPPLAPQPRHHTPAKLPSSAAEPVAAAPPACVSEAGGATVISRDPGCQ